MPDEREGERTPFGADPPERPKVTPGLIPAENWKAEWRAGVEARAEKWKRKVSMPSVDPIEAGASDTAEAAFKDKMETALKEKRRQGKLKTMDFEDWAEPVEKTDATDYRDGALKREKKFGDGIDAQYGLRSYAKERMDKMSVATDSDREKKILAARKVNLIVGAFLKGVLDEREAKGKIDGLTPAAGGR